MPKSYKKIFSTTAILSFCMLLPNLHSIRSQNNFDYLKWLQRRQLNLSSYSILIYFHQHGSKTNNKLMKWITVWTFSPAGERTSRFLIGLYSMPETRWTPSVIDSLRHLFNPGAAFWYLLRRGELIFTISSTLHKGQTTIRLPWKITSWYILSAPQESSFQQLQTLWNAYTS